MARKNVFKWFYKNGKLDMIEVGAFLAYLLFAAYCFSLLIADVATNYTWIADFAWLGISGTALIVFLKGKESSRGQKFTITEVVAVILAVYFPLMMVYPELDFFSLAQHFSELSMKIIGFIASAGALLYAAKQD